MSIVSQSRPTLSFLVESVGVAASAQALQDAVVRVVEAVGFEAITYHLIAAAKLPRPTTVFFSNYPNDWVRRYISDGLYFEYPIVDIAKRATAPFVWPTVSEGGLTKSNRRFLGDAADAGVVNGISIPIRGPDDYALLSAYVGNVAQSEANKFICQAKPVMALLSLVAHERARCLLMPNTLTAGIELSARQREILRWVSVGKSAWDIGVILGISEHTVNEHIAIAMRKLGCSHRTHAAVRAVALGLIEPPF